MAVKSQSVGQRLTVLALEIPPIAYIAITGDLPTWAHVWLIAWLSIWAFTVIIVATLAMSASN